MNCSFRAAPASALGHQRVPGPGADTARPSTRPRRSGQKPAGPAGLASAAGANRDTSIPLLRLPQLVLHAAALQGPGRCRAGKTPPAGSHRPARCQPPQCLGLASEYLEDIFVEGGTSLSLRRAWFRASTTPFASSGTCHPCSKTVQFNLTGALTAAPRGTITMNGSFSAARAVCLPITQHHGGKRYRPQHDKPAGKTSVHLFLSARWYLWLDFAGKRSRQQSSSHRSQVVVKLPVGRAIPLHGPGINVAGTLRVPSAHCGRHCRATIPALRYFFVNWADGTQSVPATVEPVNGYAGRFPFRNSLLRAFCGSERLSEKP